MAPKEAQVAVIGAGPAGLAAALSLGAAGIDVVVAAPAPSRSAEADPRTTALLAPSIELLKNLGVWNDCAEHSAPLSAIRIVDDRGGLLRAPEVVFRAEELGLSSFGANVPNPALLAALEAAVHRAATVKRMATSEVTSVQPGRAGVRLELAEGGTLHAALVVAADGRNSIARAAAGIRARTWTYPQAALATIFHHARAHDGISTELHRHAGPLTTVPLPGSASALVWVEEPDTARRLASLEDAQFMAALEEALQGLLGSITDPAPRALYPLSGLRAETMGRHRVALVGEAAHVIPPIGAQGLNLGLRDAAALADCVDDARAHGRDLGGAETLEAYHAMRAADVLARTVSVDLLNRTLLTDFLPAQALRGFGLHLLANVAALRRLVMRSGIGPGASSLPRLMQASGRP
jgi:2-octaprenyl-6-methoxyphenol hydroxylase